MVTNWSDHGGAACRTLPNSRGEFFSNRRNSVYEAFFAEPGLERLLDDFLLGEEFFPGELPFQRGPLERACEFGAQPHGDGDEPDRG